MIMRFAIYLIGSSGRKFRKELSIKRLIYRPNYDYENLEAVLINSASSFPAGGKSMDAIEKIKDFWPEWTIEGPLGRGSYGKVYSAARSDAGKKYYSAIKVMTIPGGEEEIDQVRAEGLSEQSVREYFREIVQGCIQEISMMMDYRGTANIVNVEDYKVIEHTDSIGWDIFIRMERLICLKEIMKNRQLAEEEIISLGIDISTALIDCQMDGVIHRDIKPANIFLHPKTGAYKLGDFGIATRMSRADRGMSCKGTYDYMAPEIFSSDKYDQTVDIYALGLVLYRLCNENKGPFIDLSTGTLRPSDAERAHGLRLSGRELPAPAHASAELARIIGRAVRFRPEERYQTARQMKDALEELKLQRKQAKAWAERAEQTAPFASDEDVTEILTYVSSESGKTGSPMSGYRKPGNQPAASQTSGYQMPGNQPAASQMSGYQMSGNQPAASQMSGYQMSGNQPAANQMSGYQMPGNQDRTSPMSGYQNPAGQNTQSRDPQGRPSQGFYEPQPGTQGSGNGRNDSVQTPYIPPAQVRTSGGTGRRQREGGDGRGEDSSQSGKTRGTLFAALLGAAFGLLIIFAVVFVFRDRVGSLLRGESGTASSQAESSAKGEKKDDGKAESSGKKSESANTDSKSGDTDSKPAGTDSTSSGESAEAGEKFISLKEIEKVNPEVTPTSLVYLDSAKDNFGTTYKSAIAGGTSEMENADEYILDGKYRSIAGRVVMNYDTRANVGKDTYVRIYGDGNLLWESGRVTRGFVPEDFQVDITGVSRMKLTIQGCNFIRLVDCVISEEEKIIGNSTAEGIIDNIVSGDHAEIKDLDWYSSSMQLSPSEGGIVFYGSAVDNNGTVYNSSSFGGRASDTENWNSYKISGAYSSITGKVILNNAYSDIVSENTQFRIYADGEVVYESLSVTAGRGPQEFNVSLEGVEDLRLGVVGANYMRVVDCTLNK